MGEIDYIVRMIIGEEEYRKQHEFMIKTMLESIEGMRGDVSPYVWRQMISEDANAYKVYQRILHNTGEKNKAIIAMARRLAIHLWKMSCDNKPYMPAV